MGVLELEVCALGHLHKFVKRPEDMGPSQKGIVQRYGRFRTGMNRERAVVFLCKKRHVTGFGNTGIAAWKIHHSKRKAAGTLLEALFHKGQHALSLILGEGTVIPSGNTCTGGAVANQSGHVAGILPVNGIKERLHCGVYSCGVFIILEESGANLVHVGAVRFKAHCGETAVTRYERCNTLTDEWFQILQRLFLDSKPVIV